MPPEYSKNPGLLPQTPTATGPMFTWTEAHNQTPRQTGKQHPLAVPPPRERAHPVAGRRRSQ
eukprot:scaffold149_cov315-Pinguiococcus_pyrenoidosus.AAC.94